MIITIPIKNLKGSEYLKLAGAHPLLILNEKIIEEILDRNWLVILAFSPMIFGVMIIGTIYFLGKKIKTIYKKHAKKNLS